MPGIKPIVGMEGMGGARELAEMLRQLGRGRDTVLAHITPEEAQMLMDMGGSGSTNPDTGLPEFLDIYSGDDTRQFQFDESTIPTVDTTFDLGQAVGQQQAADTFFQQPQYGAMPDMAVQEPFMPSRDVEAQMGGFYGGVPSQSELARARFAQDQMNQPAPTGLARSAQAVENTAQQFRDLARQYPTVAKLLSTGATTLPTLINAIRARREGERAAEQFRQLGAPLRQQGEAMRQQALAGQLSPQEAAAQEAARARLRQGAATRGTTTGTQAAMIENQLSRQRAQLSETKLTNAIKLLNLGNAYDEEAIRVALSANQRVRNAVANIFANLGQQTASTASPQQEQPVAQSEQRTTRRPDMRQG